MPTRSASLLDRPGPDRCRFVVGLSYARASREVGAVLTASTGHALETRVEVVTSDRRPLPRRLRRTMGLRRRERAAIAPLLAAELAEFGATVVGDLLATSQFERRLLAIGVTEPGIWGRSRGGLIGYLPMVDAGRLADLTGQNVIDAFPSRDLAQEGAGGPLDPIPSWLLLHHPAKTRVVVDLARDVRLAFLPASRDTSGVARVGSWTITPGLSLLDRLAKAGGQRRFDRAGRLAAQGRCLPELLALWRQSGGLAILPGPRWRATFAGPRRWFELAMTAAPKAGWSTSDMLATANQLIASEIAETIRNRLPVSPVVDEVVLTGGGGQNALLVGLLAEQLPGVAILPAAELGIAPDMHSAAVAAVLTLFHLDQTPACPTAITGARTPRTLGRLTPGAPQAWQRLVRELAGHGPAVVSLRSAI